jgi:phosphohistidine swiveling domain-containing protein
MTDSHLPSPLIPFDSPQADLETVGGKGANLARLARAGFPIPDGFLIPTSAYRGFVQANGLDAKIRAALEGLDPGNPAALEATSERIRTAFAAGAISPALVDALTSGYERLGAPAVAVRSSATAEDLPDLSFAGQQDTFLNVLGLDPLCKAVTRCWSSLWTARAIGYRARNAIDHESVSLAVVVQRMVQSEASGVLFTANPLTGRRAEIVIDATLGLGEALVSGQVEPDHYVVDSTKGAILSKSLGAKATIIKSQAGGGTIAEKAGAFDRQAIPDEVILKLADLAQHVADEYKFPQDIEWAWADGKLHLLQSRPVTSLFPTPADLDTEPLKVMMAFSAVQGIVDPITPLGQDALITVLTGGGRVLGYDLSVEEQQTFYIAGERIFIDFTPILSNSIGRKILPNIISSIDPGVALAFHDLVDDPRLSPKRAGMRIGTLWRILGFVIPTFRRVRQFWGDPDGQRQYIFQLLDKLVAQAEARLASTGDMWIDYHERLALLTESRNIFPDVVIPNGLTAVVAGMAPFFGILQNFARQAAEFTKRPELIQLPLEISRSLPYNVTTEMDLALWQTAQVLRTDPDSVRAISETSADKLALGYLETSLPPAAQNAISAFLNTYGMRGIGEIDIGCPRWREDPTHIMQVLRSYLKIVDPSRAPDVVFAHGEKTAERAASQLEAAVRAMPGGWLRVKVVHWAISRYRALGGLREAPKFFAIRMMSSIRKGLLESGQAFVDAGLLERADDLFFLHIRELDEVATHEGISPRIRARIVERRALREREMRRRQIPRVLLSDGTAYYEGVRSAGGDADIISGDPVSPGIVEGTVRVVFNPNGTQLAPGEILVCPGTDPAWTPLFLSAGGLVMEVGGMMTHGSVVAREYGIPAVVGVDEATTRLKTGQRIRVDGSTGQISILQDQSVSTGK